LFANTSDSNTATVWGDGLALGANLSWISATVNYDRNSSGNIVEITDSTSSLLGFHPGVAWSHDAVLTKYSANIGGKTGNIQIKGTKTLTIILGGITDFSTKDESYFMGLS
jgi:hypothetical protein